MIQFLQKSASYLGFILALFMFSTQTVEAQGVTFDVELVTNGCGLATYKMTNVQYDDGSGPKLVDPTNFPSPAYTNVNLQWSFGNSSTTARLEHGSSVGTGSTIQEPEASYTNSGVFTVSVTIDFDDINSAAVTTYTGTNQVIVYKAPETVDFYADVRTVCLGEPIKLTNTTNTTATNVGDVVNYSWRMGNGDILTDESPSYTYPAAGTYQVTLLVETYAGTPTSGSPDLCNQVGVKPGYITVLPTPTVDFELANPPACDIPFNASFTNLSTIAGGSISDYKWTFYDSDGASVLNIETETFDALNTYTQYGSYDVRLEVTSDQGCSNNLVKRSIVEIEDLSADFKVRIPNPFCEGSPVDFLDKSDGTPVAWNWDWDHVSVGGDGTLEDQTHVFPSNGDYDVTLEVTYANGCKRTSTQTVAVNMTVDPGAGYVPDFEYTIPTPICSGGAIQFLDKSTPAAAAWEWDFDDGSANPTSDKPTHAFALEGTYDVLLTVEYPNGCRQQVTKPVNITFDTDPGPGFVPDFTYILPTPYCKGNPVQFVNNSAPNTIAWEWDFGDGDQDVTESPEHTFENSQSYDIDFTAQFENGCKKSVTKTVVVNYFPAPDSTFKILPSAGCEVPTEIDFEANTIDPASTYSWDFGDAGATAAGPTSSHIYTALTGPNLSNFYEVALTVTSADGCAATKKSFLQITEPTADFTIDGPTGGCEPLGFTLSNTSTSVNAIQDYRWYIDGVLQPDNMATVAYDFSSGDHDIKLEIETEAGCIVSKQETGGISVGAPPVVTGIDFNRTVCRLEGGTGISMSVIYGGTNPGTDALTWVFGDGQQLVASDPFGTVEHIYDQLGNIDVTVKPSYNGCSSTPFTVSGALNVSGPIADFVSTCPTGNNFTFNNTTTNALDPNSVVFDWDFGDGVTDTSTGIGTIGHVFATGTWTVTMKATNPVTNCFDIASLTISNTTTPPVFAVVKPANNCHNADFTFNYAASPSLDPTITEWHWDMGDGTHYRNATSAPISHNFAPSSSPYDVVLTLENQDGCFFVSDPVAVTASGPTALFQPDNSTICDDETINFIDFSSVEPSSINLQNWSWNFGDGQSQVISAPSIGDVGHLYNFSTLTDRTIDVTLTVTDTNGCIDSQVKQVVIKPKPDATFETVAGKYLFCKDDPGAIEFAAATGSHSAYNWDFDGTGIPLNGTSSAPSFKYDLDGVHNVTLNVIGTNLCANSFTRSVEVVTPEVTA